MDDVCKHRKIKKFKVNYLTLVFFFNSNLIHFVIFLFMLVLYNNFQKCLMIKIDKLKIMI